jgi:hypothetical protein
MTSESRSDNVHRSSEREALEAEALELCPTGDYYDLMDGISDMSETQIHELIEQFENSAASGPSPG